MHRMAAVFFFLACAFARADLIAGAEQPDIVGEAFGLDSGDPLYQEHHFCNPDRSHCRVLYIDGGGEVFASKDIEYGAAPSAPGLHFRDFRNDLEVRLAPSPDTELVVDAGFDNYVRQRWAELVVGERIRFPFLMAGRDSPLAMRAGPDVNDDCDPQSVCLEIELDSWLLGMLVDPIELTYDRDSRRLLRFRGISNLKDDSGKTQKVDIRYSYPPLSPD